MTELDAMQDLIQEFDLDPVAAQGLRAAFAVELRDEREYIKSHHPGTRNQYELAVEKTHKRLQGWLRDGMTVPDWLDQWHRGIPLDKKEMTEGLLRWVGTTRRAAVWCGLCWLARRTKREEKKV